jgi:hypothetical protein
LGVENWELIKSSVDRFLFSTLTSQLSILGLHPSTKALSFFDLEG